MERINTSCDPDHIDKHDSPLHPSQHPSQHRRKHQGKQGGTKHWLRSWPHGSPGDPNCPDGSLFSPLRLRGGSGCTGLALRDSRGASTLGPLGSWMGLLPRSSEAVYHTIEHACQKLRQVQSSVSSAKTPGLCFMECFLDYCWYSLLYCLYVSVWPEQSTLMENNWDTE